MIRTTILMCIALSMIGCTLAKAAIALQRPTGHFVLLEEDPRVRYEVGAKALAKAVSDELDQAVRTIERLQYREFAKPVRVHICNTVECFAAYCVVREAAGCVLNERLFLSPKESAAERLPRILRHELSHLHLEQQLGMIHWHLNVPAWFQEGLAVYASGGGGAEKVSPAAAKEAIALGRSFFPDESGRLFFRKSARSCGLKAHMFYRQASLFVRYLHRLDASQFKALIRSLGQKSRLGDAISSAYGMSLSQLWKKFVQEQKEDKLRGRSILFFPEPSHSIL